MPSEIKHFPVNWVDGMKISKSHLLAFQHAIDDQIRDSISISHSSLNFGLLPYAKIPNDLSINVDQAGNIHINLKNMRWNYPKRMPDPDSGGHACNIEHSF